MTSRKTAKKPDELAIMEYRTAMMDYRNAREKMRELTKKYEDIGKEVFKEDAKVLFNEHPDLKSFSWKQYTPYFNDGDSCVFSAHTDYPSINGMTYWDEEEIDEEIDGMPELTEKEMNKIREAVSTFLSQYPDHDLEDWFGDHVEVTVTAEEVKTDRYDHD